MTDLNSLTEGGVRSFSLYAAGGRIYVQNAHSVLIDIGSVSSTTDGFGYRIDGSSAFAGRGFAGADDVLRDLRQHLDLRFLENQFDLRPDVSQNYSVDLNGASHLAVALAAVPHRVQAPIRSRPTRVSR